MIINTIFDEAVDIVKALFCDDGLFWATGKTVNIARDKIRRALNCLTEWSKKSGFKFSATKTFYIIFTRKNVDREPIMYLCGTPIDRKFKTKYLGVIFDSKLTWKWHILDLVERCKNSISLLKMVARQQWGGDRKSLTILYTSLIRSKIDYSSFLYSTAASYLLIKLDRIQYDAIRIITGLLRSTLVAHLEAEAFLIPLKFRREQLMLNYFCKIIRITNHPVTKL